mgnify:CR=1 FL=1
MKSNRLGDGCMTSLKDIAKIAGVAKSTVSRYLNQGQVSEKTKEKIRQAIEETGYRPNNLARSLKSQSSKLIGVVIPRFDSGATSSVLKGLDQAAFQSGYQLLIINSNLDRKREAENLKILANQKVAGIILLASHLSPQLIQQIDQLPLPIIVLGQKADQLSYICHDDYQAGYKVASHLADLNYQNIFYIGVSSKDPAVGIDRKKGFLESCNHYGQRVKVIQSNFSKEDNYKLAQKLLKDNLPATYIACATDHMAIAFLKAAQELNYVIPDQLAISGFGGYNDFDYYYPGLTTVKYPYQESGTLAFHSLLDLISGQSSQVQTVLDNQLLIRESTQVK